MHVLMKKKGSGTVPIFGGDYMLYAQDFSTGLTDGSVSYGDGNYAYQNGVWVPVESNFGAQYNGSTGFSIDTRTDNSRRWYVTLPSEYLNQYDNMSYKWVGKVQAKDTFGTLLTVRDEDAAKIHFGNFGSLRVDHGVANGQSGWVWGKQATTSSNTWDNAGGFNWYNTTLTIEYLFSKTGTSYLYINGYPAIVTTVEEQSLDGNFTSPLVGEVSFVVGNYRDGGPSDNGIQSTTDQVEIIAWNDTKPTSPLTWNY